MGYEAYEWAISSKPYPRCQRHNCMDLAGMRLNTYSGGKDDSLYLCDEHANLLALWLAKAGLPGGAFWKD